MKDINLPKGLNKLLLVAGTIVVVFILFTFFIRDKISQYFETKKTVEEQNLQIEKLSQRVNELNTLSENELSSSAELLFKTLPEMKDFYGAVNSIKKIFQDEGGTIESYSFNPGIVSSASAQMKNESNSGNLMDIKINFFADFDQSAKIVERIINNLPILSINSFSLVSENATNSSTLKTYTGNIDITAYNSPLLLTKISLEKPLPKMSAQKMSLIEKLKQYGRVLTEESNSPTEVNMVGKDNPFPY